MLQYKIPQNVQVEDKIVSFLTLRQLIICGIGGGIAYVFYISLAPNYYAEVWMPPVFLISAITIAIAFVKVNDVPFTKWTLLLLEFIIRPRKRAWDKSANTELLFAFVASKKSCANQKTKADAKEKEKRENDIISNKNFSALDEITKKLDLNPFAEIEVKKDRIDESSDNKIFHNALMSEDDIENHNKRIDELFKKQKQQQNEKAQSKEIKKPISNIIAESKNVNIENKKEEKIQNIIQNNTNQKPPESPQEAPKNIIQPTKQELPPLKPDNIQPAKKEETIFVKPEDSQLAKKEVSKEDFLRSKNKKISRKAFPLPNINIAQKQENAPLVSQISAQQSLQSNISNSTQEEKALPLEGSNIVTSQEVQPKRFTPVREKKQIDTVKKPAIPEDHEILLNQIKEGEISINFSNNNE